MAGKIIDALVAGLLLGPLPLGIGGLWTWWLPAPRRSGSRWIAVTVLSARALVAGLLLTGLVALILGLAGRYTPGWEALGLALLLGGGHILGLTTGGERFRRALVYCWPGAAVAWLVSSAVLLCPVHSEWIVGGLDPGVYVNEAVALDREGTFRPADGFFHRELAPAEQTAFTRSGKGRTERFPGIAADTAAGAFEFEFFRLFPAIAARFHRVGGAAAVVRVNMLLGLFAFAAFAALLLEILPPAIAVLSALMLLLQPIWLYHLHVPIAEMLQLLLLCGAGLLVPWRKTGPFVAPAMALVLAAGVLAHFSFLPIGALLVCAVVWIDLARPERRRVFREHLWLLLGLVAGWSVDVLAAPVSFVGWGRGLARVGMAGIALGCLALAVDAAGARPRVRAWLAQPPAWARRAAAAALGAFLLLRLWGGCARPWDEDAVTLVRLLPYLGLFPAALGLAGALCVFSEEGRIGRTARGLMLFWGALTLIMLVRINDWTIPLYPWALRRYLPCAVPLAAVGTGFFLAALWRSDGRRKPSRRFTAGVLCAALVVTCAPRCRRAWLRTEYGGAHAALAAVARRLSADDIVLADHPAWGTPLRFMFGRRVLDGRHFYRRGPDAAQAGLDALRRLARAGRPVRLLTSTEAGLDVYPVGLPDARVEWRSEPLPVRSIAQARDANDFMLRERTKVFTLYRLPGPER
ncbi:MAG: hypothetical protein FJ225_06580 [Lentisphaerae bacterium]|nr:hypothetical protein [Lentisphaerota bacterium]